MYEFKLPDLGEGVHEGEILKWHVSEGGTIAEDAPLVDVETDKAAVTIPSPAAGTLKRLGGKVGDVVMVGNVIAVIDDGAASGAAVPAPAPARPAQAEAPTAPAPAAPPAPSAPPPTRDAAGPVPAAPAVRRLAREMGIDLHQVTPSGPGGRVTAEDLNRFQAGGGPAAAPARAGEPAMAWTGGGIPFFDVEPMPDFEQFGEVEREPLRSIRRKVAHRMVSSMVMVPHVAHMDEADVTELERYRVREKERLAGTDAAPPTLLAFVAKAVAEGLKNARAFNASLDPFREEIVYKRYINIGIAVDTGRGLIVPVVRGVDTKSVMEIAADIRALAERARAGTVDVSELRGGTFTITNVGPLGGTALLPTINYPEVAILGLGKVQEKPVVRDGEIVIRSILPLSLAFDHRVADGADAARFVSTMMAQLADPLSWLAGKA
ncbi:MAG: 2-oxo acid dehydrogenase subunit E2 [Candidatus Latescibacteria bacterium]|nr:2-oxo acid dehydrogenase subunit E2 [Candidatus Latescibacterota bacterium]